MDEFPENVVAGQFSRRSVVTEEFGHVSQPEVPMWFLFLRGY